MPRSSSSLGATGSPRSAALRRGTRTLWVGTAWLPGAAPPPWGPARLAPGALPPPLEQRLDVGALLAERLQDRLIHVVLPLPVAVVLDGHAGELHARYELLRQAAVV